MKRYSILLLFTFLFTNAAFVCILDTIPFILHKISIKEIIKSSDHLIEKHTFCKSTFEKLKIDKSEFKFDEVMYDIISTTSIGDSIIVVAYQDLKESLILKGIKDHSKDEKGKVLLKKIMSLVYCLPERIEFLTIKICQFTSKKYDLNNFLTNDFLTFFFHPPAHIS
jgi:hypothetical protein